MSAALLDRLPAFRRDLLTWYHAHQRDLPWRRAPSLYKTVVSEFMLQQTQVKTVLPYFARWLEVFPDFAALAAASEDAVLKRWEGLGYYTRARNLHKLARALVTLPELPRTREAWQALPGIGPYSSAAITSIALGVPAACVDGNVVRILARLTADATPHRDSARAAKAFTALADALIPADAPGDHNQAMMELGATVCHRRAPLCTVCPVRDHCAAVQRADPEAYPRLAAKNIEKKAVTRVWCVRPSDGTLLLHRADATARCLADLHELPLAVDLGLTATDLASAPIIAVKKRGITRYAITETIHHIPPPVGKLPPALRWVSPTELDRVTLSGPHRRWISTFLLQTPTQSNL